MNLSSEMVEAAERVARRKDEAFFGAVSAKGNNIEVSLRAIAGRRLQIGPATIVLERRADGELWLAVRHPVNMCLSLHESPAIANLKSPISNHPNGVHRVSATAT